MFKIIKPMAVLMTAMLLAGLLFSGCGSKPASGSAGDNDLGSLDKEATVTHYTMNSDDKNYVTKLVPEFEKANPKIKINVVQVPYDQFDQKLQTMIAGGTPPDVTSHWGNAGFIEFYSKNQLVDLTPIMEEEKYNPVDEGISQELLDIYKINGKQFGIPVYSYVSLVIYNKDMFKKAGLPDLPTDYEDKSWTWDKLIEYAKKLTNGSPNAADATYGLDWAWSEPDQRPLYFGEQVYSEDTWSNGGHPSETYFDSSGVMAAYQRLADLIWKDKIQLPESLRKGIAGTNGEAFASGRIGMTCSGAWVLSQVKDYNFNVGVAAVPVGGNEKIRDVIYIDPLFILRGSKNPKAAFQWIKYQLKPDIQEKALELSGGTPPANSKAMEKYYNLFPGIDPKDVKNVVEGGIKYGAACYGHKVANYSQIWTIVSNETDPMFKNGKSAAEVCPPLQKEVTKLLEKVNKK